MRAFDEGAVIRSRRGRFSRCRRRTRRGKGTSGRRISPRTFPEHRFGPLRFVPARRSGPSLLVVDGLRASFSRRTGELRRLAACDRIARGSSGQGLTTVVMFLLVPQVKLREAGSTWRGRRSAGRPSGRRWSTQALAGGAQ